VANAFFAGLGDKLVSILSIACVAIAVYAFYFLNWRSPEKEILIGVVLIAAFLLFWLSPQASLNRVGFAVLILIALLVTNIIDWTRTLEVETTVIVTTRDLPPYSVIQSDDVQESKVNLSGSREMVTKVEDAVNHVTTSGIAEKTPIAESDLIQVPEGWLLLSVPLSMTNIITPAVGQVVELVGVSEREQEPNVIYAEAISLGADVPNVVFALPADAAYRASTYLLSERRIVVIYKGP
jgi:hypothetical protein